MPPRDSHRVFLLGSRILRKRPHGSGPTEGSCIEDVAKFPGTALFERFHSLRIRGGKDIRLICHPKLFLHFPNSSFRY